MSVAAGNQHSKIKNKTSKQKPSEETIIALSTGQIQNKENSEEEIKPALCREDLLPVPTNLNQVNNLNHQFNGNQNDTLNIPNKKGNNQLKQHANKIFKNINQKIEQKSSEKRENKSQIYQSSNFILKSNYLSSITIDKPIKMKVLIDTGAENINLLSKKTFRKWQEIDKSLKLLNNTLIIQPLGGEIISNLGAVQLPLQFDKEPKQYNPRL